MSTLTATPATMHRQVRHRAVAATTTVVTALLLWALAVPLLQVSLTVRTPGTSTEQDVGAGAVLATSLLVSLARPLTAAAPRSAAAWLMLLHLSVAAVLIPLLRRTTVVR